MKKPQMRATQCSVHGLTLAYVSNGRCRICTLDANHSWKLKNRVPIDARINWTKCNRGCGFQTESAREMRAHKLEHSTVELLIVSILPSSMGDINA